MADLNRIISYFALSIVLLFGVAVVSGIFFDLEWKVRLGIGVVVGLYVIARIFFMLNRPKPRSLMKHIDKTEDD